MKVNLSSTPGNVHVEIVGKNMITQRKPSGDIDLNYGLLTYAGGSYGFNNSKLA
jgi:hypothetical protein